MIPHQIINDILDISCVGFALACIWYWVFVFYHRDLTSLSRNWWLRNICPQGIVVAIALKYLNLI